MAFMPRNGGARWWLAVVAVRRCSRSVSASTPPEARVLKWSMRLPHQQDGMSTRTKACAWTSQPSGNVVADILRSAEPSK